MLVRISRAKPDPSKNASLKATNCCAFSVKIIVKDSRKDKIFNQHPYQNALEYLAFGDDKFKDRLTARHHN